MTTPPFATVPARSDVLATGVMVPRTTDVAKPKPVNTALPQVTELCPESLIPGLCSCLQMSGARKTGIRAPRLTR
jgi:hypothetical protein